MKKIHGEDSGSFFMTRFSTFQVQQAKFSTEKSMLQAQSYFFGTFLSLPQRLERFWRWAHKNLMQINKATCRVLMCRWPCPSHAEVQVGWRGDWEQPWKKDLGCWWMKNSVWPGNEHLQPKSQPGPHHKKWDQQVERSDPITSLSRPLPGVQHLAVEPSERNLFLY